MISGSRHRHHTGQRASAGNTLNCGTWCAEILYIENKLEGYHQPKSVPFDLFIVPPFSIFLR